MNDIYIFFLMQIIALLWFSVDSWKKQELNTMQQNLEQNRLSNEELLQIRKETKDLYAKQNLIEISTARIYKEVLNLSKSIGGNYSVQGKWGEMLLTKILEQSGLREGVDFFTQYVIPGTALRPDVMIKLPQDRYIIIDSKVSLTHYNDYINSESEDREIHVKNLYRSVSNHIKSLASKNYVGKESGPNMIIAFMPVESAFSILIKAYPNLLYEAEREGVIISTPFNLIGLLRLITQFWSVNEQHTNYEKIQESIKQTYDSLYKSMDEFNTLGLDIEKHYKNYQSLSKSLLHKESGLIRLLEKVEESFNFRPNSKQSKIKTKVIDE